MPAVSIEINTSQSVWRTISGDNAHSRYLMGKVLNGVERNLKSCSERLARSDGKHKIKEKITDFLPLGASFAAGMLVCLALVKIFK